MQRIIITIIAVVILQSVNAQGVMRGVVIDKDTHEAIIGATITDESKHKKEFFRNSVLMLSQHYL